MSPAPRHDAVTRAFHWLCAGLVLVVLPLGLLHEALKPLNVMPLHKGLGLVLLVLGPLRLAWRMRRRTTLPPPTGPARAVHALLYLLVLAMPFSGWVVASAGRYPLRLAGVVDWPKLAVAKGDAIVAIARQVHAAGGWALTVLLVVHIGAALWHHFYARDAVLRRML